VKLESTLVSDIFGTQEKFIQTLKQTNSIYLEDYKKLLQACTKAGPEKFIDIEFQTIDIKAILNKREARRNN
jgi:hypothetical protein